MGKFEKKKRSTATGLIITLSLVLIAAILLLVVMLLMGGKAGAEIPKQEAQAEQIQTMPADENQPEDVPSEETQPADAHTEQKNTQDEVSQPQVALPLLLESGKLEIHSLFQSDGMNPDCANRDGDDIATLMLTNTAESMLTEATITAKLADASEIRFLITNLPAGKTAMAFSGDNISLADDAVCVEITCEAVWNETDRTIPEGLSVTVDGMMVTITNHTAQEISELIVYCRTPLGEEYFGGMAYEYKINNLSTGKSATFTAEDCVMGLAEVVLVEIK